MSDEFKSYIKVDYSGIADWQFIPHVMERDQCDHVWVMEFTGIDGNHHRVERRCERDGKFRHGDTLLCGYHTPGYGRKGSRRVPQP
jgi:hypothetical protein